MQALQNTTSITPATMRALYKQYGDPGDVAYYAVVGTSSRHRTSVLRPHPPLLIQALYQELRKIASAKGEGSQKFRQGIIEKLMLSAVGSSWKSRKSNSYIDLNPHLLGEEPRYLVRTLVHNLRVGAVRTTILSALARAVILTAPRESIQLDHGGVCNVNLADLDLVKEVLRTQELSNGTQSRKGQPNGKKGQNEEFSMAHERIQAALKGAEIILRRAFAQHPSYDDITTVLLEHGVEGVLAPSSVAGLTLGTPLLPTLGSPMRSLEDIYDLLGPQASWCAEKKYDGQRAQVHAWRDDDNIQVRIFSRHLENMTDKVIEPINYEQLATDRYFSSIQTWYT
jgi:DNA ligase 1